MTEQSTPVHILTGFLGSGKTTLLNTLLKLPAYEDTLVIVNEFGEISVDHHLVEASTETIFELSNGCLCCSIRGELVETLLTMELSRFQRVIIETTGIADPLPVFQSLSAPELNQHGLHPAAILSVYDNVRGEALLKDHAEARRQLALADAIFVSRTDQKPVTSKTETAIAELNTWATRCTDPADIVLDEIENAGKKKRSGAREESHLTHMHQNEYASIVLTSDQAQPLPVFAGFLHHLSNMLGPNLLRAKGFGFCIGLDHPVLLQMSGQILHDPVPLDHWPDGNKKTRMVIIGKNINLDQVRSIFNSFFDVAAIDTPDREALTNNPLSISGMR